MYESLNDFKNFLIERKLAPENQITFYANWVSKFIRFSNVISDKPIHLKMQIFIDDLKNNPKIQDGQIVQAENAVKMFHFKSENVLTGPECGDSGTNLKVTQRTLRPFTIHDPPKGISLFFSIRPAI